MADLIQREIAELLALAEAATQGPWKYHTVPLQRSERGQANLPESAPPLLEHWICTTWNHPQLKGPMPLVTISSGPYYVPHHSLRMRPEDARLVVGLLNAAPRLLRLLAAAKRLEDARAAWSASDAAPVDSVLDAQAAYDAALAAAEEDLRP